MPKATTPIVTAPRMSKILILSGPNLNMLGRREPEIYGSQTLDEIYGACRARAQALGLEADCRQTNHEGVLIDWVQEAALGGFSGLIINAGGYTHTSVALHDALRILQIPIIEVHLSDPKKREDFRTRSFVEPLAAAVFAGHGGKGYEMALEKLSTLLKKT